jgi:hypothetical protein
MAVRILYTGSLILITQGLWIVKLLIATQNKGKVREYQQLLGSSEWQIIGLEAVGLAGMDVEETGSSFEENAIIKAKAYAEASGLLVYTVRVTAVRRTMPHAAITCSMRCSRSRLRNVAHILSACWRSLIRTADSFTR